MIVQAPYSAVLPTESWTDSGPGRGRQPVVEIPISALSVSDSPRLRGVSADHVRALAAAQVDLPPIIVHRPSMCIIDGMHRLRAAELRGQRSIAAQFFSGDEADAFVLGVKSNIAHGLPLSLADKKYAASRVIGSHPQWSDRMIAAVTGLAAKTIADMRRGPSAPSVGPDTRIGQDGRVRPINASERRKAAFRIIQENPRLPLREIARIAGISPETARDVRNRLYRGENPLTRQQRARREGRDAAARQVYRADAVRPDQRLRQNRVAAIQRLRADPAIRLSESGRLLLRLFNLHTVNDEAWDKIIQNVPPHCHRAIASLARECAQLWTDFAERVERKIMNTA